MGSCFTILLLKYFIHNKRPFTRSNAPAVVLSLEGEQEQEGHHETEQAHGLGQGESQNGVGEQLLLEGGVASVADDQGAEHRADSRSRSGHSDCGGSGTDELGSRVNVLSRRGCGQSPAGADRRHGSRLLSPERGGRGPLELGEDVPRAVDSNDTSQGRHDDQVWELEGLEAK